MNDEILDEELDTEASDKNKSISNLTGKARSLANLRPIPWKKGQSGNPKGRPKMKNICLTHIIKELALEIPGFTIEDGSPNQANNMLLLVQKLYEKTRKGDLKAIEMVLDRTDGKVLSSLLVQGNEKKPVKVQYVKINQV